MHPPVKSLSVATEIKYMPCTTLCLEDIIKSTLFNRNQKPLLESAEQTEDILALRSEFAERILNFLLELQETPHRPAWVDTLHQKAGPIPDCPKNQLTSSLDPVVPTR